MLACYYRRPGGVLVFLLVFLGVIFDIAYEENGNERAVGTDESKINPLYLYA